MQLSTRAIRIILILAILVVAFLWFRYQQQETSTVPAETSSATTDPGDPSAIHVLLGNPDDARADAQYADRFLISRPQYVVSYNSETGIPNWVAWHLDSSWLGPATRKEDFDSDPGLPAGWYRVTPADYTRTGYDRGHVCPSADRTRTDADNDATFLMTNILPQTPGVNRGPWGEFEDYLRDQVRSGHEVYSIAGGAGELKRLAKGRIVVPASTWKVSVILPVGTGDLGRITTTTRLIAIIIPNEKDAVQQSDDWVRFQVSVDQIEATTGLDLLEEIPDAIEAVLESRIQ